MELKLKQSWYDFYKNKVNKQYYYHITRKYKPFIDEIKKELREDQYTHLIEMGCGIGSITKYFLKKLPYNKYTVIDNDVQMLGLTAKNFQDVISENVIIQLFDITFPYFQTGDIIHSHGVLEHFDDCFIEKIIYSQLKVAPIVIHYVPSNKYDYKSFGDERLLSKEYWMKHFNPTEIIEFNNGYDLILKWRR